MRKEKITKEEINSIFQSSGGVKKEFVEKIKLKGLSEKYGNYLFYQTRKKSRLLQQPVQQLQAQQPVADANQDVTIITADDVKPVTTTPNNESDDLKLAYKKLFEQETGESIPEEEEKEPNATYTAEAFENDASDNKKDDYSTSIKMSKILKQIGIAINNNILWKERTLDNNEILLIEQSSEDIELKLGDALATEDAPWYNYLIFTLAVPAMSRVDMIPMKIRQVSEWITNMQKGDAYSQHSYNTDSSSTEEPETDIPKQEQQSYATGISDAQKQWINSLREQGYSIEQGFNPNFAVDYAALRDRKIARNK